MDSFPNDCLNRAGTSLERRALAYYIFAPGIIEIGVVGAELWVFQVENIN